MSSIGKGQESLRNHRAAGIGILIGYGIVCLLGNFFLVHIAERVEPFNWTIVSMWILGGLVFSQAAILVVWLTLGADSLRRRTFIFVCGTCACFASWLLGYLVNLETNLSMGRQGISEIFLLGYLPVFLLGFAIPLLGLRFIFGRQLVKSNGMFPEEKPTRHGFSIASLLVLTFLVAAVGGAVEFTSLGFDDDAETRWFSAGICLAVAIGCCLFGILPLVIALLRERGFWLWLPIVVVAAAVIGLLIVWIVHTLEHGGRPWRRPRWDDASTAGGTTAFALMMFTTLGLCAIRLLGFRLEKVR